MRIARNSRNLSAAEVALVTKVFKSSLPPWHQILITDGLGPIPTYDNPYTDHPVPILYTLNLGPEVYPDATLHTNFQGFGSYRNILVHEMTHVWQYFHGYAVVSGSIWANTLGAGYTYDTKNWEEWDDYNVEQQASIVEDWFAASCKEGETETDSGWEYDDPRFFYVKKYIRGEAVDLNPLVHTVHPLPTATLRVEVHSSFEYLVPILQQRFAANDVGGYGARVRKLEDIFNKLETFDARDLRARLEARSSGDKVAQYFYANLSTPTRLKLLGVLKNRYPYAS